MVLYVVEMIEVQDPEFTGLRADGVNRFGNIVVSRQVFIRESKFVRA